MLTSGPVLPPRQESTDWIPSERSLGFACTKGGSPFPAADHTNSARTEGTRVYELGHRPRSRARCAGAPIARHLAASFSVRRAARVHRGLAARAAPRRRLAGSVRVELAAARAARHRQAKHALRGVFDPAASRSTLQPLPSQTVHRSHCPPWRQSPQLAHRAVISSAGRPAAAVATAAARCAGGVPPSARALRRAI